MLLLPAHWLKDRKFNLGASNFLYCIHIYLERLQTKIQKLQKNLETIISRSTLRSQLTLPPVFGMMGAHVIANGTTTETRNGIIINRR